LKEGERRGGVLMHLPPLGSMDTCTFGTLREEKDKASRECGKTKKEKKRGEGATLSRNEKGKEVTRFNGRTVGGRDETTPPQKKRRNR